jgi:thiamine pyrophosphate-dependent acetolactate synthase large subunit-like protein
MLQSPNGIGRCDNDDKIAAMSTQAGPTGAETLVNSLAAEGVDTIFGLPGLQLDYIFDALYGSQDAIRVIHTRHEQATASSVSKWQGLVKSPAHAADVVHAAFRELNSAAADRW